MTVSSQISRSTQPALTAGLWARAAACGPQGAMAPPRVPLSWPCPCIWAASRLAFSRGDGAQCKTVVTRRKWQPTQYSCLGNPMDRGAWRATVLGFTKSCT